MGTSNFYNKNASKIFAVRLEDEWDFDDLKLNLLNLLKEKGYWKVDQYEKGNRSFTGIILATNSKSKLYGDEEVFIRINAIIRSGYYTGCNLDWDIDVSLNSFKLETDYPYDYGYGNYGIDDILISDFGWSTGLAKIQSQNIKNWIEQTKEELIDELESVYKQVSEQYVVSARFSNGETLYKKV